MTLKIGKYVKLKEDDFISKPYKIIDYDKKTATVEVTKAVRLRNAYNLKVPLENVVYEN